MSQTFESKMGITGPSLLPASLLTDVSEVAATYNDRSASIITCDLALVRTGRENCSVFMAGLIFFGLDFFLINVCGKTMRCDLQFLAFPIL